MSTTSRTLVIGPLEDKISKQLEGLLSQEDAESLDRLHSSLTNVYISGLISDSAYQSAAKKLMVRCQTAATRQRMKNTGGAS